MGLDINTLLGQESLIQERKVHDLVKNLWKIDVIETPKSNTSACDGFLIKKDTAIALFETKCRNMSYAELINYGSWMVTLEKIRKCVELSKLLQIPFLGFLYLLDEPDPLLRLLYCKFTDNSGNYIITSNSERTRTQDTINGGIANRINAYIPINYLKRVDQSTLK